MTAEDYFVATSNGAVKKPDTKKYQWGLYGWRTDRQGQGAFFLAAFERFKNSLGASNIFPDRPDLSFREHSDFNYFQLHEPL
jgi:hypothetical protein